MDLVNKLWNFCHTLRHEGVDYNDYIEELTYLLFLKLAEEIDTKIPDGCDWATLIQSPDSDLLSNYNSILRELSNQSGILKDIFSEPIAKIHNSSSLRKLLNLIDEINWHSYNQDVLGATFEGLLERAANESKKGAGQYFTPRPLIQAIVKVMKPDPFESPNFKISDIACGTAGFLTESFAWWKSSNEINKLTNFQREKLVNNTYIGQELVIRPRRLALMNMYLHGLEPTIILGDTIYEPIPINEITCSCLLTNPPFGTKGSNQIPDRDFAIKTSNKQLNFIQHAYEILEPSGRAAIVLPDSVLFEDKATELWEYLMKNVNIHTILKLPLGTFSPYAQGVKANVIFFQKNAITEQVWIYDARTNIPGITKKDRPLSPFHFEDFENCYGDDPNGKGVRLETERFKKFDIKNIEERNFNLNISWINPNTDESNNHLAPDDLLSEAIAETESLLEELKSIFDSLESNDK
ncbi:restriction endonuclease subunit S [Sphingobacteriaceae bacterium GW460-11-11-14-LB5]|nr:restriction endonuclease subunit S [Sphingobacteriaceae bacterium GW460-11-11-14-LB5]